MDVHSEGVSKQGNVFVVILYLRFETLLQRPVECDGSLCKL